MEDDKMTSALCDHL